MTKFLKLDEAAQLLGMSADEVIEARSKGQLHGYRDGSSWKFKQDEIERFRDELAAGGAAPGGEDELLQVGDLLGDEDDDAILVSEEELGSSESASSTIIGRGSKGQGDVDLSGDSDLKLAADVDTGSDVLAGAPMAPRSAADSDVQLVAGPEGSDVKVVPGSSGILGTGSDELKLDLSSGSGSGTGELADTGGSSDFSIGDDEEVLSLSDEDDLVLASGSGTGSDLAMPGSDTGINLASPSDSGLLLEDDALDLGSVSSLELPEDVDETLEVGAIRQDDEFNLGPPAAGGATDDESSSQIIELGGEDAFAAVPAGDVDPFAATDVFTPIETEGLEAVPLEEPVAVGAGPAAEDQFSAFNIAWLSIMALVLAISGILMIDLVRNMWVWNDGTSQSVASSITEGLISAVGLNR